VIKLTVLIKYAVNTRGVKTVFFSKTGNRFVETSDLPVIGLHDIMCHVAAVLERKSAGEVERGYMITLPGSCRRDVRKIREAVIHSENWLPVGNRFTGYRFNKPSKYLPAFLPSILSPPSVLEETQEASVEPVPVATTTTNNQTYPNIRRLKCTKFYATTHK